MNPFPTDEKHEPSIATNSSRSMSTPNETHLRAARSLDAMADAYSRPERVKMFAEELSDCFPTTTDNTDQKHAYLSDLLAVIHRDGGHYEEEHGVEKAFNDALSKLTEHYLPAVQSPAAPALTSGDAELVCTLNRAAKARKLQDAESRVPADTTFANAFESAAARITALSAHVAELSETVELLTACKNVAGDRIAGLERDKARLDWLEEWHLSLSRLTSPDMSGLRFVGQAYNPAKARGKAGGSYIQIQGSTIRGAIDAAMNRNR